MLWEKQEGPEIWCPPSSVKWKRHLKKSTSQFQKKLEDMLKKLKGFLLKEYSQKTLKDIKECLPEAATLIKDVKAHSKELTHMSNKTMSKTSSKK